MIGIDFLKYLWAERNSEKGRRLRKTARRGAVASVALLLYIDRGNQAQDARVAELVEQGRQKHESIEKMGDVRYAATIQILSSLQQGVDGLQQEARSQREMTLTLLKELRANRAAQLLAPRPHTVSNLSPGLFSAWRNGRKDSGIKEK